MQKTNKYSNIKPINFLLYLIMTKLLNRIAWILSVSFAFILSSLFAWDGYDAQLYTILIWIVFVPIIKFLLFSENYIKNTVVTYANKVVLMNQKATQNNVYKEQDNKVKSSESVHQEGFTAQDSIEFVKEEYADLAFSDPTNLESYKIEDSGINDNENILKQETVEEIRKEEIIRKEPTALEKFLSENLLAKIGWLLLFIWVLFFLSLIYKTLWSIGKLTLGFIAGFTFYGIGVFIDKIWYQKEGRILLGVWILVNYLVILSWRYIIGNDANIENTILSETTTFLFLILNTIFGIVTSLVYKSEALLFFSFVVAYLNPFLIWAKPTWAPYTMVLYWLIISFGAFLLSYINYKKEDKEYARALNIIGFIWWCIMFLSAPFATSIHWVIKLLALLIISITSVMLTFKKWNRANIHLLFFWAYFSFIILLFLWWDINILNNWIAFFSYTTFLILMFVLTVYIMFTASVASLGFMLFAPLVAITGLLFTGNLYIISPVIIWVAIFYISVFMVVNDIIKPFFKYIYFIFLAVFFFLSSLVLQFITPIKMDMLTNVSVILTSFLFLFSTYFFSRKKNLEYFYAIWTLGTVFILLPILDIKWPFLINSIIAIAVLGISNALLPFINRNLCEREMKSLIISIVSWILFVSWEVYRYWVEYYTWLYMWFAFMGLAVVYFILGFLMMQILQFKPRESNLQNDHTNTIFGYLGISISLFSVAVLKIFADEPALIAGVWLFEATILFFFYYLLGNVKIYLGAVVLFFIWITKFGLFSFSVSQWNYYYILSSAIFFISFVLNLKFLEKTDNESRLVHDILHIGALVVISIWLRQVMPHTWMWYSIFALSIFLIFIWFVYNLFAGEFLKISFIIAILFYYIFHIFWVNEIFTTLENIKRFDLKILQYLVVIFFGAFVLLKKFFSWKLDNIFRVLLISYVSYLFIISTIFIYDLTENVFSITIFWAIWCFFYLFLGIKNDLKDWRTVWLYILTLVLIKILLYDVWYGINDTILRVVALMFVWWLMIYISMLYSQKYSWNLMKEFDLKNLGIKGENDNY